MRINTNVAALNSYNQLSNTQDNLSKSLERLSSGKRINGAADDAAGLAISEKMNGQVRGLGQAQRNAQDAISMNQTAEGALKESHSILQRMRELAVQSANDTNTEADRAEIQEEVNQLSKELTRIGNTTEFNTQKLLDGSLENTFQIGSNEGQNMEMAINDMRADNLGVAGSEAAEVEQTTSLANTGSDAEFTDGSYEVVSIENYEGSAIDTDTNVSDLTSADDVSHVMIDDSGEAVGVSEDGTSFYAYDGADTSTNGAESFTLDGETEEVTIDHTADTATATVEIKDNELDSGTYTVTDISNDATYGGNWDLGLTDANGDVVALGATDESGTSTSDPTAVTNWVDVNDTTSTLLGTSANSALETGDKIEVKGAGVDVSSQEAADSAITTIDDAIGKVSSERSKLGAVQNRLEHTINNLNTAEENLTAAESRISDVDMAEEMMNMSKQQILSQAGTAMMAQANQLPQGVLQLLG